MSDAQVTVIWGWYSNASMMNREVFATKSAAWARVREIMEWRSESVRQATGHSCVSVLEVYAAREDKKPGASIATFRAYEAGSKFCRWGNWGVYNSLTTGELFG